MILFAGGERGNNLIRREKMQSQFLRDATYIKRAVGQILRVNTEGSIVHRDIQHHFSRARTAVVIVLHARRRAHIYAYVYEFWEFDGRRAKLLGTGFGFVLACNSGRS